MMTRNHGAKIGGSCAKLWDMLQLFRFLHGLKGDNLPETLVE